MTKTIDTVVRVRDQASQKFGRIGTSATTMGSLIKRAAIGIGFYFGARQVASIIRYGAEFEKTMSRVKALTQANEVEHRKLTESAKRLGERTVFTAKQVADGMSYLALAGFEVDEIIASMPATLDLAAAGQVDLAQAADITAKIMRGMGLDVDELGHAVDVLAKGFTTANTDLVMLGEAFSYVGPLGRTAGKSLEELVASIQVMSDAGIQASMAGTSMRQILGVLSGATESATKRLRDLGITTTDTSGKLRPMADIVDSLNEALANSGPAEKTAHLLAIFGKRAGPGMAALLNEGSQALRDYEQAMVDAAGTAKQIAETQLDNVAGELTKIGSVASGIILSITSKTQGWLKDYLARFRTGLIVMGVVINNMGLLWDIFWTRMKLGTVTSWEDMKHLFGTQIPELFKWFARNWREIFTNLWKGTKAIFVNMAKNIGNFFKGVWSWLKGEGYDFKWTGLLEGFESTLKEMPKIVKRGLSETEKALRSELDALQLRFAQKIAEKFDVESAEVTKAAKKSAAKVLDFEEDERKKTARAAKAATLQAVKARFLTFAPGTQFNYQKVMAENTGKQTTLTEKLVDASKEQVTLTKEILAKTIKTPVGTSGGQVLDTDIFRQAARLAVSQLPEPKLKIDLAKELKAVTADVNKQNAIAAQIYMASIIKKSIADAYAKKNGKTEENTSRQVAVSEQILSVTKQDKTIEQSEKQLALTGKLVTGSNQQVQLTKEMLTNIQELNENQGPSLEETSFK